MWWLGFLVLVIANDAELEELDKRTKMLGCVEITRLKMAEDEAEIDQILATTIFDQSKVIDKIAAEMLLNCYHNIDLSVATDVMKSSDFTLTDELRAIVTFEKTTFTTNGELEMTNEEVDLITTIEKEFERAESRQTQNEARRSQDEEGVKYDSFSNFESFKLGFWFLPVVFGLFFGLILLGARSLLKKQEKTKKKSKAKKTN
jgi:hypothetical protein